MEGSILAQKDRIDLGNGLQLRLLSALEVLQARREAAELARALERTEDGTAVFADGRAVLAGLTVEEIGTLAARWSEFHREVNPGLNVSAEELENVKKNFVPTRVSGCAGGC